VIEKRVLFAYRSGTGNRSVVAFPRRFMESSADESIDDDEDDGKKTSQELPTGALSPQNQVP